MIYFLIIANIMMVGGFILRFNQLPPQIPLFYSKQWGEDQLVDLWFIFLLPLILILIFYFNNFVYDKYFSNNILVKKIIYYLNLFIIIIITFIFLKIIILVS